MLCVSLALTKMLSASFYLNPFSVLYTLPRFVLHDALGLAIIHPERPLRLKRWRPTGMSLLTPRY